VRQDVRDVGDVVEKFTGGGNLSAGERHRRNGAPSKSADFRGGLCYLDAVEPGPAQPRALDRGADGQPCVALRSDLFPLNV
jgi:hypothetical protein